jgi:hypothetical protein
MHPRCTDPLLKILILVVSTGALGHRLSAFLFLKFYRDFQGKILLGISYTNFQNPFYRDFPVKKFPLFSGPWAWVGLLGCPAAASRVRAPMRGTKKHRQLARSPAKYLVLKSLRKI